MSTIEKQKTTTSQDIYQGDRYELAKMMVETQDDLKKLSKSLGNKEKLAQLIYDPNMDNTQESFFEAIVESMQNGKGFTEAIKEKTQETAKKTLTDGRKDTLQRFFLSPDGKEAVEKAKKTLETYSSEQVVAELQKLKAQHTLPELEDEEDVPDNDTYNPETFATQRMKENIADYITKLPTFTSVGYLKNPKTGTTLCSKTARLDMKNLFNVNIPNGNAFDTMRKENGDFHYSLVSELYQQKETATKKVDKTLTQEKMADSTYISSLAGNNDVAELYVTSSTTKGRKYGHRATMFRIDSQWFVIDPYTTVQPGEQKNKPRTLESYAKSMKTGRNKREFMRMNFYNSQKIDTTIAQIKQDTNNFENVA